MSAYETDLPPSGISRDMARFLVALARGGRGYAQNYTTLGNSLDFKLAENEDCIFPALTVVNQGAASVRVGLGSVGAKGGVLLPAGASCTFRWFNPRSSRLLANDLGNAGVEIDVFG